MESKIATKRLKRKRLLAKRVMCHGTKEKCSEKLHPKRIKYVPPAPKVKVSWWKRLLKFLRIIK